MAKVELSIDGEMTINEFLDMCEHYNIDFRLIESRGPDGDNPLFEFVGDAYDIKYFASENQYDEDDEDDF